MKVVQGKGKVLIALVTLFLSLSVCSWSQTGTSTVRGVVTDAQGRVVSGAEVTLTNTANGNVRTVKTTDSGVYNFDLITPSTYRLEVVAKGFKNREIAKKLGMSQHVVRNYLGIIYDKVGVSNRVELALWYEARVHEGKFRRKGT